MHRQKGAKGRGGLLISRAMEMIDVLVYTHRIMDLYLGSEARFNGSICNYTMVVGTFENKSHTRISSVLHCRLNASR